MTNKRKFQHWDAGDDAALKRLAAQKLSPTVIATRMCRGRRTIEIRAARLGIDLEWARETQPWTARCDAEFKRLVGEGLGSQAISGLTGRTPAAARKRCSDFGLRMCRDGPSGGTYVPPAPEGPLAEAVRYLQQLDFKIHKASVLTAGVPDDVYQVDSGWMSRDEIMTLAARKAQAAGKVLAA